MNDADNLKNHRGSPCPGPDPHCGGAYVPVLRGGGCVHCGLCGPVPAGLSCVAGAVCIVACVGLSLLAFLCLLAGQTAGCIAMFVLAFLVSPFGLPALGGWLVERLHGVKYAAMDFMAS